VRRDCEHPTKSLASLTTPRGPQIIPELLAQAAKPLPGVFHQFEGTLKSWGYLAVAAFLFLEDFGVPLPGETMLIAASLYAGAGHLNVFVVGLVGFLAAVAGDNVGYVIGRFGGRELVERYGKWLFLTGDRLDRGERFFERHGGKIVVGARFVEGLRQLNGIIAGIAGMHWARFVIFNALGAALWVSFWTSVGYFAGNNVETVSRYFTYFAIAAGVLFVAVVILHLARRRRRRS
jgi:membrane protein DedA with SNARE-associated domain